MGAVTDPKGMPKVRISYVIESKRKSGTHSYRNILDLAGWVVNLELLWSEKIVLKFPQPVTDSFYAIFRGTLKDYYHTVSRSRDTRDELVVTKI